MQAATQFASVSASTLAVTAFVASPLERMGPALFDKRGQKTPLKVPLKALKAPGKRPP